MVMPVYSKSINLNEVLANKKSSVIRFSSQNILLLHYLQKPGMHKLTNNNYYAFKKVNKCKEKLVILQSIGIV